MLASTADVLDLPATAATPLAVMDQIEHGLPFAAVERMAQLLAPGDAQFKYRLIPKATYERRKRTNRLSPDEGTLLARLARIWALALDIWEEEEATREFLFRRHMMMEDRRPVDVVIQNEIGAEVVAHVLGRLKYGTAA